ncbi:Lsr2 family protein [Nocardioides sp. AN3]
MAQRVHIVLEDDLDGSEGVETVSFALDGKSYEIDLNEKNATKLRKALAPFIDAGRKASRASAPARKSTAAPAGTSPQEIRAWAKSNGYDVPDRGRIPASVRQAFEAAN